MRVPVRLNRDAFVRLCVEYADDLGETVEERRVAAEDIFDSSERVAWSLDPGRMRRCRNNRGVYTLMVWVQL